jgi:mannitol-specific phosphotransferase system IIBC component
VNGIDSPRRRVDVEHAVLSGPAFGNDVHCCGSRPLRAPRNGLGELVGSAANFINGAQIRKIIVACEGGMGSSLLVAAQLARKLEKYAVEIENAAVDSIPADADLLLCQDNLVERVRSTAPDKVVLGYATFLGDRVLIDVERAIAHDEGLSG